MIQNVLKLVVNCHVKDGRQAIVVKHYWKKMSSHERTKLDEKYMHVWIEFHNNPKTD